MAFVNSWHASLTVVDSKKKLSNATWKVSEAAAEAWISAADEAARLATTLGVFLTRAAAMMEGTIVFKRVYVEQEQDNVVYPSTEDGIYNNNKFVISHRAALKNYTGTLPTRKISAVNFSPDGETVLTTVAEGGTQVTEDFLTSWNLVVLGDNGIASVLLGIRVND